MLDFFFSIAQTFIENTQSNALNTSLNYLEMIQEMKVKSSLQSTTDKTKPLEVLKKWTSGFYK